MLEKDINLVRKIAWNFHRSTSIDFDDLFSEACVAYLEAEQQYDKSRGKFPSYIYMAMTSHLMNVAEREKAINGPISNHSFEDIEDWFYFVEFSPEKALILTEKWEDMKQHMSPVATAICEMLFNKPAIFIQMDKPKLARGIIRRYLRDSGWTWNSIWDGFHEITEYCHQY